MIKFVDLAARSFAHAWAIRQQEPTDATPTPFPSLNAICGDDGGGIGLAPGWFITVGGGTGQGKSLLAQNMALHALRQGRKVGFLTLEMSYNQLAGRFYAMATGTPVKGLERGRFDLDAFGNVWDGLTDLCEATNMAPFYVNSDPIENIEDVMTAALMLRDEGAEMIVLDYLQLVSVGDEESVYKQVTEVAGKMRRFANKEGVTVLALSQYNTPTGRDTSQKPSMYGLMGGGTVANNGDMVILLDHSRYDRDDTHQHIARTYLLVPKNRHGSTGQIPVEWDYRTLRVREAFADEEHLWRK